MGGLGSGRHWHWDARQTTSSYRRIDVRRWARGGFLKPGRQFSWQWSIEGERSALINVEAALGHVRLQYRSRSAGEEEWQPRDYKVRLLSQQCHLPEIRLAVEIDGSIHLTGIQKKKDMMKDADATRFDITVLRLTNSEVAGNKERLTVKLREAWRLALRRENRIVGKPYYG